MNSGNHGVLYFPISAFRLFFEEKFIKNDPFRAEFPSACRATHRKNVTHKYLDLKINLSELLQILCETYAPP
ncbi:hypothetical protein FFZ96_13000 [Leptospira borgpetersenii]|nr:hypothetical protein FFZ96_13000 [Leptospira borgpetersenii]